MAKNLKKCKKIECTMCENEKANDKSKVRMTKDQIAKNWKWTKRANYRKSID